MLTFCGVEPRAAWFSSAWLCRGLNVSSVTRRTFMSIRGFMSCPSASRTALSGSLKPVFGNRNALLAGTFLFLGCLTAALFWPIIFQGFIGFDDPEYLTENPNIQAPLSWSRVIWALETGYFCSWHPITWLSYMVDYQFYGLNPAGYHFTNLMFHALNASLLFLLFHRMTGYIWRSALV